MTVLRVFAGLMIAFVVWVGSAQLAVFCFGPDNNIIILVAVAGMTLGVKLGFMVVLR